MKKYKRLIEQDEKRQRGCAYCADSTLVIGLDNDRRKDIDRHQRIYGCKHVECPYHELDNIKDYSEYEHGQGKTALASLRDEFMKRLKETEKLLCK